MADLEQTAANVSLTTDDGFTFTKVQYGESVTQGMPVYRSTSDSKYYQTDANTEVATSQAAGIALTPGIVDEYGLIVNEGSVDIGATLTVGETYVVSGTKGKIAPIGDLTSGDWVCILGIAETTSKLLLNIQYSTIAKP